MAKNLNDLADSLIEKAKAIDKAASKAAIDVALAFVKDIVYRTPVDTSNAISNWQVSIGAPIFLEIAPYYPGYAGYTQFQSAEAAIQAAMRNLQKKRPGQTIYITNNAPYIKSLNSGSSRQAPAGFVEASVLLVRKRMPTIKLDLKNG